MSTIDLNADFGDIELTKAGDLSILTVSDQDIVQAIVTLLKTEYGDYRLRPYYGIDFQKWIGQSVGVGLADTIKAHVTAKLNSIPQIKERNPEVYYIIQKNAIAFRIISKGIDSVDFSFIKDKGVKVLR